MRANGQMTGMLGVYLTAAELTKLGFIVSLTSRSAFGADLLVTDRHCRKTWSVQVKTNRKAASFWLVGPHAADLRSRSHVYVFVNNAEEQPEYFLVPSADVARIHERKPRSTGSIWHQIDRKKLNDYAGGKDEAGHRIFRTPTTVCCAGPLSTSSRHGRAWPGHPRITGVDRRDRPNRDLQRGSNELSRCATSVSCCARVGSPR